MLRTHTCGELRHSHVGQEVTLCGWVQTLRNKGHMIWVDLRDRYGITQLICQEGVTPPELIKQVQGLGREYVIQVRGCIVERVSKNEHIPTGDIEVQVQACTLLNTSQTPPFLVADKTDGGEELRMQYRYLDLRRAPLQANLLLRHQVMQHTRAYLAQHQFLEIETPLLIKSTPEGARDFVVPSRIHPKHFYALPQSPQLFKQLLMVAGVDRYYQLAKCFRDEDLRADRQPEFTQIDCEMAFATPQDIQHMAEGLIQYIFSHIHPRAALQPFRHMTYTEAMQHYGTDKPDLRFDLSFLDLTPYVQAQGCPLLDTAELVLGMRVPACAHYTRKQLDALAAFVKQPDVGASGLMYVKYDTQGNLKSSVDKFYTPQQLLAWMQTMQAVQGDLVLLLAGEPMLTRQAMGKLRLKLGDDLGLRDKNQWVPVWIVDFPLVEWDTATGRYQSLHHPFTAPQMADIPLLHTEPTRVRAHAYDLVINGFEIGGGSIRIHQRQLQEQILGLLGLDKQEADQQFGFFMEALDHGAPPHGGIAFGLDRLCALLKGEEAIRPFIAFPKNNAGRDVMAQAPAPIAAGQLHTLGIKI